MFSNVQLPERLYLEPMLVSTAQGTALYAISNILAQFIENRHSEAHVNFSWIEFVRFTIVMCVTCPPTFYWQIWLERNWPGEPNIYAKRPGEYLAVPAEVELGDLQRDSNDSRRNRHTDEPEATGPRRRNWKNVWIKWSIDNSLGALWYTLLFIVLMEAFKGHAPLQIWQALIRDTLPLLIPSYIIWPAATLFNFIWIPAEKRVVFLAFVGLLWGIYLSIFSSDVTSPASTSNTS